MQVHYSMNLFFDYSSHKTRNQLNQQIRPLRWIVSLSECHEIISLIREKVIAKVELWVLTTSLHGKHKLNIQNTEPYSTGIESPAYNINAKYDVKLI